MTEEKPSQIQALKDEITRLRRDLRDAHREEIQTEEVKRYLFQIANAPIKDLEWVNEERGVDVFDGIPTLFASDFHWGETVNPHEIQNVNSYNITIARERCQNLFNRFVDTYKNKIKGVDYPGCVLVLGGDMLSGNIHEELRESNDDDLLPCIVSLTEELCSGIKHLKSVFNKVAIFCVTGNHGRSTHKMRFKRRAYTNFDWLTYTMCEKHFMEDKDIVFNIPTGPDCIYQIYNTRYLLTHGDTLGKGGDGMIGMLGPVTRGDVKRRTRQVLMHEPYDVMICGHFHQLAMLRSRIVNGSLKGYDEYAHGLALAPEPPMQASWITHPRNGITMQIPIMCEGENEEYDGLSWVSWQE